MAKKKNSDILDENTEINMTSMIDVVFLLIIYFLCLKFKTLEGKLAAYLPKDVGVNTNQAEPMEKLDIHIYLVNKGTWKKKENRKIWSNRKIKWQVDTSTYHLKKNLEAGIKRLSKVKLSLKTNEPIPVTVHAHRGVHYGEVTRTVDYALFNGFKEVTFSGGYDK